MESTQQHKGTSPEGTVGTETFDTPEALEDITADRVMQSGCALIVDDWATDRLILTHLIAKFGFTTVEATNGREGLERLAEHPEVELILVDWNMPEMTGLEFVKEVRANESYQSVPIVMVTVREQMGFVMEAIGAGANEYLMKPYTLEGLESKLSLLGINTV